MQQDLSPVERQKLELQRDAANVAWTIDVADELLAQLTQAESLLAADPPGPPLAEAPARPEGAPVGAGQPAKGAARVAALVPVDPQQDGCGIKRSLADVINGSTVIQATLERLADSHLLERIILIVPEDF